MSLTPFLFCSVLLQCFSAFQNEVFEVKTRLDVSEPMFNLHPTFLPVNRSHLSKRVLVSLHVLNATDAVPYKPTMLASHLDMEKVCQGNAAAVFV